MSARRSKTCGVDGCDAPPRARSTWCDLHTHDWVAAAEVPLAGPVASWAVDAKKPLELPETTYVRVLDVYCGTCRLPFTGANGTSCNPRASFLRGGRGDKRNARGDVDDGQALPSTA